MPLPTTELRSTAHEYRIFLLLLRPTQGGKRDAHVWYCSDRRSTCEQRDRQACKGTQQVALGADALEDAQHPLAGPRPSAPPWDTDWTRTEPRQGLTGHIGAKVPLREAGRYLTDADRAERGLTPLPRLQGSCLILVGLTKRVVQRLERLGQVTFPQ